MGKFIHLWLVTFTILAGLTGCGTVQYVDNDSLLANGIIAKAEKQQEQSPRYDKEKKWWSIPKEMGALKIATGKTDKDSMMFFIKRDSSKVFAEARLIENTKHKYFDRVFFSIGGDHKDYIGMQWRFEDDDKHYFEKAYLSVGANKRKERVGFELLFQF